MIKARRKVAFVVNPKAGTKGKGNVAETIKSTFSKDLDYEIIPWEFPGQWPEIKAKILNNGFDIAVAVGGDGTVNQLAKTLIDSDISLAILPRGSGNGLARHLSIPLMAVKAIELISQGKEIKIDSCCINDEAFFCTAGIGFDAHIGTLFAKSKTRGFLSYVKITLTQLINYKPQYYHFTINGQQLNRKAFLITFANASQYGNNAYIAPQADIKDGLIDVCILNPFNLWNVPGIMLRVFNKTAHRSKFIEIYKVSEIEVQRQMQGSVHCDGESFVMGETIKVSIKPSSLKVIVPKEFV